MGRNHTDSNDPPARERRSRILWGIALVLAAAAVTVNMLVIDASNTGIYLSTTVAVLIAATSGGRAGRCGRRHAK